ncbi:hypothetical protein ACJ72_03799 [Emergomyces africanus]|uniref:Uncharacterized protein n=1 Tax=Emergomyces africanus TaxID=1955775 RepID=A0A1B7NYL6_9EURO|nr:hypothetical protein ACJ72_03799 [Emergomyces africanus]
MCLSGISFWLAFAKTIREFYGLRYMQNGPGRRNLMRDSKNKKSYVGITMCSPTLKTFIKLMTTWNPPNLCLSSITVRGEKLVPKSTRLRPNGSPHDGEHIEDVTDDMLEKLAANAVGKELVFRNTLTRLRACRLVTVEISVTS